jgi:hypothetical protein
VRKVVTSRVRRLTSGCAVPQQVPRGGAKQDHRRRRQRGRERPVDDRLREQLRRIGGRGQPRAGERDTGQVQRRGHARAPVLDQPPRDRPGDHPERHVDQEQPSPAGIGRQQAAGQRGDDGRDQRRPHEQRRKPEQIGLLGARQHDEPPDGHHDRAAGPLDHAERDEFGKRGAERTPQRCDGEDDDCRQEHPACAPPRRQPSAQRDQCRQRHQVGGDHETDGRGRNSQSATYPRGRRGHDRAVEVLHEETGGHQQRGVAQPLVQARRRDHALKPIDHASTGVRLTR